MHGRDVAPVVVTGVLEGELRDAPARLLGDELDALHDPVHDLRENGSCLTGLAGAGPRAVRTRHHVGRRRGEYQQPQPQEAGITSPTAQMRITEGQRWSPAQEHACEVGDSPAPGPVTVSRLCEAFPTTGDRNDCPKCTETTQVRIK